MNTKAAAISSTLAVFIPWLIFAPRRLNRSFNENNPINSVMDVEICAAQSANALEGAKTVKNASNMNLAETQVSAEENIKKMASTAAKAEKGTGFLGHIWQFTRNNINKIIGISQFVKVLFSDNKERDAIVEGAAFGGMIAAEKGMNHLIGRSKTEFVNGELKLTTRKAQYKKIPLLKKLFVKTNNTIVDTMSKNKALSKYAKYVPGVGKGILFAGASIAGFNLGHSLAEKAVDNYTSLHKAA